MISSVNLNKMLKKDLIKRCRDLENILIKKYDYNIAQEILNPDKLETKTQYGIDAYFNKENEEEEVCINVKFNDTNNNI
jgi:hypothetical protein